MPMRYAGGSPGKDYSPVRTDIPVVGANFGVSGPYANYVLLGTIPQNDNRAEAGVENITGSQIVIVRDDGTAATAAAPKNASIIVLGPGAAVGAQGASWNSQTFKGRLQVYGPSSSLLPSVWED